MVEVSRGTLQVRTTSSATSINLMSTFRVIQLRTANTLASERSKSSSDAAVVHRLSEQYLVASVGIEVSAHCADSLVETS